MHVAWRLKNECLEIGSVKRERFCLFCFMDQYIIYIFDSYNTVTRILIHFSKKRARFRFLPPLPSQFPSSSRKEMREGIMK